MIKPVGQLIKRSNKLLTATTQLHAIIFYFLLIMLHSFAFTLKSQLRTLLSQKLFFINSTKLNSEGFLFEFDTELRFHFTFQEFL